ncbi:MAG: winged helix-turn-helix domain-containing protein [Nitrospirota bacterium]
MNKNGKSPENDISLKILDEISRETRITQRTLSSELNVALGLVNTYIKRLAKKGYIKITKGPMNRVKYALTKKGFTHRVKLTYNYMHSSIDFFKDARKRIDNTYRQMIASGAKNVLIWGDGEVAELSYISMRGLPLNLVGVIDGKTEEKDFFGHHIYSFEDIDNLNYDAILLTSFDKKEVERIRELGIDEKRVYSL